MGCSAVDCWCPCSWSCPACRDFCGSYRSCAGPCGPYQVVERDPLGVLRICCDIRISVDDEGCAERGGTDKAQYAKWANRRRAGADCWKCIWDCFCQIVDGNAAHTEG